VDVKLEPGELEAVDEGEIVYEPIEEMYVSSNIEFLEGEGAEIEDAEEEEEEESHIIEQEDYQFEVVVDEKNETPNLPAKRVVKPRQQRSIKTEGADGYNIVNLENGQKLYQCDVCSKTFKDRSKMRVHREIHTSERNIICEVCSKHFKTLNCLRNHRRQHTERTYHNCDVCDKKYTQKVQLKKHIEIVHMKRRDYTCETCE